MDELIAQIMEKTGVTADKAKEMLGWEPEVSFQELIEMMVDADMELVERELRTGVVASRPTYG